MAHPISSINEMSAFEFAENFSDIAEHSPWISETAATHRPYSNRDRMIESFVMAMNQADQSAQLALVRAHPDLAGRAAIAGDLTADSTKEQAGAGLDQLTEDEFTRFTSLNALYKEKFDFPFIFAVKGATKHLILEAFETRIHNSTEAEFLTALENIARIFTFRLQERVSK